jgi:MSHA biogenesis protein MshQ
MLVGVSYVNNSFETVSSVTFNGDALSFVGAINNSDDARVEIFQLTETAGLDSGTHDVVVTFSADLSSAGTAGVMTFTGVDQATPLGTFASAENDGSGANVTVSSATDELVFAIMAGETVGTITTDAPATEHWNQSLSDAYGAGATEDGAASVNVGWSHSSDHWAAGGVSIKPAQTCGGGGGSCDIDQTDDFIGLPNLGQTPFGNWSSVVNSPDSLNAWCSISGSTGSNNTGPSIGNPDPYVYLESSASGSSSPCGQGITLGSVNYLESNTIDASAYDFTFDFDWNMNGTAMDTGPASLHVDAWNGSSWDLDVSGAAINTGNNGDVWVAQSAIDLSAYSNSDFKVRLRYVASTGGNIYQNDVAVDNLHFCGTLLPSGGSCDVFRDEFNSIAYTGSDGTGTWSTNWLEINESDGASSGDEQVVSDDGSNRLRVQDNDGGGEGVQREADLSDAVSATLSFDYRRDGLDDSGDYVRVDVSANGGSSWTELDRFEGPATDGSYTSVNYDITSYIASNTRIRFRSSSGLGGFSDRVYFDNVEISTTCGGGGGTPIDHFAIDHDGYGINCQAENITITAHDSGHSVFTDFNGTVKLSTTTSHGDWSVISGAGTLVNNGRGAGHYAFSPSDSGVVVLGLRDTFVETTNVNTDHAIWSEDSGEDDDIDFARSGFNFLAGGSKNTIGTQIGGKDSDVAPGAQTLELQAVKTSDDTGACEAALVGSTNIELAFECENPTSCSTRQLIMNGTDLPQNTDGTNLTYNAASMDFGNDTDSTATFTMNYPEVGEVRLHARYRMSPSAEWMLGGSNSFVVRPFAFSVSATGNPVAVSPAGLVFTSAGTDFSANVSAVLWEAADDTDNDGIADDHDDINPGNNANLMDNAIAFNYGQETSAEQVSLTALLDQPAGGNNPGLSGGTSISIFNSGIGTTNTVRYDEVGIIEISAAVSDGNYLGIGVSETGDVHGNSGYVGRFNPAQYAVTSSSITPACSATFTYARQPFTGTMTIEAQAGAAAGNVRTENYRAGFVTLDPATELVFINDQTTAAYDAKTVTYNQNFDSGSTGEAVLALQFRWDMPEQVPTSSTVQNTAVTDEVTTLAAAPLNIGSSPTRYGRVAFISAVGSELVNLGMPMRAEYYVNSSTGYVTNTNDSCSSGVSLSFSNFAGNLDAGETCVLDTGSPGDSGAGCVAAGPVAQRYDGPPISGEFNLSLQAPGAGNDGAVSVDAVVPDWLMFDWDAAVPGLEYPSGRATFGIYRGHDKEIYRRELY